MSYTNDELRAIKGNIGYPPVAVWLAAAWLAEREAALTAVAPLMQAKVVELDKLLREIVDLHDKRGCVLRIHMDHLAKLLAAAPEKGSYRWFPDVGYSFVPDHPAAPEVQS
jgi:hypothetical protein